MSRPQPVLTVVLAEVVPTGWAAHLTAPLAMLTDGTECQVRLSRAAARSLAHWILKVHPDDPETTK